MRALTPHHGPENRGFSALFPDDLTSSRLFAKYHQSHQALNQDSKMLGKPLAASYFLAGQLAVQRGFSFFPRDAEGLPTISVICSHPTLTQPAKY